VRRAALALGLALLAGCIVNMGTSTTGGAAPQHVPVPDKYAGGAAPELVDAGIAGCKQAPSLDPNLYYCAREEHWFRYALNRWYLAFEWDGNWFPTSGSELPRSLAALTPKPEEVKKSREDKLKELEDKLQKIDEEQQQSAPQQPPAQQPAKSGH
jgi:hypothetical protein